MVCFRCKIIVETEFEKLGIRFNSVEIGKVNTSETPSAATLAVIKVALLKSGLELVDNKKGILIDKVKNGIIEMVQNSEGLLKTNFSRYLSAKLGYSYTYLANIFSEVQGTTIEQYIIEYKVQRVKELISHKELNITQISWKLHYSSVAHLSAQFKKVTGETPSHFKQHVYSRTA